MNTYAFIVGIETYGEKDYTVQGPCANAIAVARWLLEIGTPGKNIHIFLNPGDPAPNIDDLHKAEVHHHGSATRYQIDDFWKKELAKDCPSDSRLFVFWSGHGGTGPDRRRLLLCHDYDAVMNDRFFDITNFLEHLKTPPFQCFNDQIALVDVCGVYLNHPVGVQPDPAPKFKTQQLAYFASPEGCYAAGEEGRGVFTNAALSVLKSLPGGWPVQKEFAHDLWDHLGALKAPGFRIGGFYDGVEHPETVVGIIPANGKSPRIFTEHLPTVDTANLFGRDDELDLMSKAWLNQSHKVISFVAAGGVGKSAICKKWLAQISAREYLKADRVYAWSFYSQGTTDRNVSADPFIQHALEWFGDPNPQEGSDMAKGHRLACLIKEYPTILILDGLEPLQFPPGDQEGYLKDRAIYSLLYGLIDEHGRCLTIITTRVRVTEILDYDRQGVHSIDLQPLSDKAGAQLLQSRGVRAEREDELETISREFGGHSLALLLLGNYLAKNFGGWAMQVRNVDPLMHGDNGPARHAKRVMNSYLKWFQKNDKQAEIQVLKVIGLFDRPATAESLEQIRQKPSIAGLTDQLSHLTRYSWNETVDHLRSVGLLLRENPAEPGAIDAHPLVREHFGEMLQNENFDCWRKGHRRLFKHLAETLEEFPNDSHEMNRLYSAVNHACACGERELAFKELIYRRAWRKNSNDRDDHNYSTRKLGLVSADFVALAQFFQTRWSELLSGLDPVDELRVYTDTGVRLRALGRLPEAMEALHGAVNYVQAKPTIKCISRFYKFLAYALLQWARMHFSLPGFRVVKYQLSAESAYAAASLCELQLTCGRLQDALVTGKRAVQYADAGNDPYFRMHSRSALADVYMQRNEFDQAGTMFEDAKRLEGNSQIAFMHSQTCYRYGNFLVETGQPDEVVRIARENPDWGKSSSLLSRAIDKLVLARARIAMERPHPSLETAALLKDAVLDFGQSGYTDYLIRGLTTKGELLSLLGNAPEAVSAWNKALKEAERGDMRLLKFDVMQAQLSFKVHLSGSTSLYREEAENLRNIALGMGYRKAVNKMDELLRECSLG